MKKSVIALLLMVACVLCLTACGCEHEWANADCVNPVTCSLCGKTEGEPLGHVWMAATCEAPKTCEVCALSEGEAKGHDMAEATCEEAQHCKTCDLTEGEALGHAWLDATTETPQTCERCALTEGERIITDSRFTTEATKKIQGSWFMEMDLADSFLVTEGFPEGATIRVIVEFENDGDMDTSVEVTDSFVTVMKQYTVDGVYEALALEGYDKEAADAAFAESYGMSIQEYADAEITKEALDTAYAELFKLINIDGVYYVKDGLIYTGIDWDEPMTATKLKLEGDKLSIDELTDLYGDAGVLTRVSEE